MVSPLDFTFKGVQDPLESVRRGLEFGQAQALRPELLARDRAAFERQGVEQQQADVRFGQGNVLFEQGQQDRQTALADADRERQDSIEMQADLEVLADNPTAEGFASVITRNPQIATEMNQAWQILDKDQQQSGLLFMGEVFASIKASIKSGDGARTITMLENRIEALNNTPGREEEAQQTQAYLETFKADPESALVAVGVPLKVLGGNTFDDLLGKGPAVQSSVNFQDGTIITVFKDGRREVKNPEGKVVEGADAARTVAEANAFETQVRVDRAGGARAATLGADIGLGGEAASVRASGTVQGTAEGEAIVDFEGARQKTESVLGLITAIKDDPALEGITGSIEGRRSTFTNQDKANLMVKIEQLKGRVFLEAFQALKGGGTITETEGAKAEAALARLNRVQSPEEFRKALDELTAELNALLQIGANKAGGQAAAAVPVPEGGGQDANALFDAFRAANPEMFGDTQ